MAGEYIINYSSDALKSAFTILPRTINTDTTLTLFGKGAPSYGEGLQENMVHLLENFASEIAPPRPTIGQAWYKPSTEMFHICTEVDPIVWRRVGIKPKNVAPTSNNLYELWLDTTLGELNYWDGTAWVSISGANGSSVSTGTAAPADPVAGQLWVDTGIGVLKYWSGTSWISVGTNNAQTAYLAALMLQLSPARSQYLSTLSGNVQDQLNAITVDIGTITSTLAAGKVSKSGDTMTGFLKLHADPVQNLHAATKRYVDTTVFNALQNIAGVNEGNQQHQIEVYVTAAHLSAVAGVTTIVLSTAPSAAHVVYVSGVEQSLNNYTLVGATLTLSVPVAVGTEVLIDYYDILTPAAVTAGDPGVTAVHIQTQVATAGQTIFSITIPYAVGQNRLFVFVDGVKQWMGTSYNEPSATSIVFTSPLPVGTEVTTISYVLNGTAGIQRVTKIVGAADSGTTFAISPPYHHTNSVSDPYNVSVMVYVAGVVQGLNEYIQTNGASIVLSSAVSVGTPVEIFVFNINALV